MITLYDQVDLEFWCRLMNSNFVTNLIRYITIDDCNKMSISLYTTVQNHHERPIVDLWDGQHQACPSNWLYGDGCAGMLSHGSQSYNNMYIQAWSSIVMSWQHIPSLTIAIICATQYSELSVNLATSTHTQNIKWVKTKL